MAFGRYEEINGLLDDLLKLPSHERAAFLERSCGADTSLHDTLNALLAAHEVEDGFLDVPALLQLGPDQNSTTVDRSVRQHYRRLLRLYARWEQALLQRSG